MRRGQLILIVAASLGVCMFFCARMMQDRALAAKALPYEDQIMLPELEWLRSRFSLDPAQFERIRQLHIAYRPKCQVLCQHIQQADRALLDTVNDPQKDFTAALKKRAEVQIECQQAMLVHMRETAACMSPAQAREYLETVLPHFLGIKDCCEANASPPD